MKALRLLPEVLEDVAQAARWYDEKGYLGLGERFLGVFYASLPRIQQDAEIHRPVYHEFRRILLKPFPYAVYYRVHNDLVVISLVIHAVRSPHVTRKLLHERKDVP
jgi:ParE toxin of type II toxin-antitoxin system, parDE